jgi:hypothetical protein
MAGKLGSNTIAITCDDAPGGTPRTISPYVDTISEIGVEAINELTHPFGSSNHSNTPTGMTMFPDITLEGWFDTTATVGPHVVFIAVDDGPQDVTRTFTFTPGESKTFTAEVRHASYKVIARNGQLSRYRAVLKQAGAGAWT